MPGIVGLISKMPRERAGAELCRMLESMRHEAFYATGTKIHACQGVYVGWTSPQKSSSDAMPLCNEQGDVDLVFSGGEYPEPGTIAGLKRRGHSLEADGPS